VNTNANMPPQEPGASVANNPYYTQHAAEPSIDSLDAGAPVLQSAESQRVNKKALAFLGGVVVLLAAAGMLLLGGKNKQAEPESAPRQERVEVPTAPVAPPLPAPPQETPPIELAQSSTPPLPPMPEPPVPADAYGAVVERGPSLVDRRTMSEQPGARPSLVELDAMRAQQQQAAQLEPTKATSAVFLNQPDTLMLRGTFIRCALETRIITDVNGFTSCVVTEPVYSVNGRSLLLPKGSKVYGQYGSGAIRGERVAVVWDRITTPTGIDVTMASPGVDNLGSAGHPGHYNAHWGSRISSALFISLLSDAFKYYGEKEGPVTVTTYPGSGAVFQDPYESNTARTLERLAGQAVDASANRQPTVTINQGTIVNVYVSQDVDFSGVMRN
jgi:type IV secretion system protein VirB10